MSDNGHHVGNPTKYDRNGDRSFKMGNMKMKTCFVNIKCEAVPVNGFDVIALPTEISALDPTVRGNTIQGCSRDLNPKTKGDTNGLILAFETPAVTK